MGRATGVTDLLLIEDSERVGTNLEKSTAVIFVFALT